MTRSGRAARCAAPGRTSPGQERHPYEAQDGGHDHLSREFGPEQQSVGKRGEDDKKARDEARVCRGGEQQARRLEEVGCGEHDPYGAAHFT
jgi:hypothetical protein